MSEQKDERVPDGAPWDITDSTVNMYEVRFHDNYGVPVMIYQWTYEELCRHGIDAILAWREARGAAKTEEHEA